MKFSIHAFLAFIFVLSTLTTSLHELLPHHSSDCQVCTLVQNDTGLVPSDTTLLTPVFVNFETIIFPKSNTIFTYYSTLQPRAPPFFS